MIHLAFKHDIAFTGDFQGAMNADYSAVEVFGEALAGSGKPLVIASGIIGVAPGRVATEQDGHGPADRPEMFGTSPDGGHNRAETADFTLSLASRGVRSSIVRLAPTNHGQGDNGFLHGLVQIAKATGVAAYIGDGSTRWSAVHRLDSGALFALAVDAAPAGSTLHGTAEEGVALRDIAEAIGRGLDVPVRSISAEDAPAHFGFLAGPLMADCPASSAATQQLLGWTPSQPGIIADLDLGHYFA